MEAAYFVLFSFFLNFLGGCFRVQFQKFSELWFLGLYVPALAIAFAGVVFSVNAGVFLIAFLAVALGQRLGSTYKSKRLSPQVKDALEQLPDLWCYDHNRKWVSDSDTIVVLMNMGGPRKIEDVKPFLRNIFMDPMVIRFPFAFLLQPIMAHLLLKFRLPSVEARYRLIGGGSPILAASLQQDAALKTELHKRGRDIDVTLCFNYSVPFPKDVIKEAKNKDKRFILPLSLYPHYSKATTGSSTYHLKKQASTDYPGVKFIDALSYHLHDGYIQAFVDRIHAMIAPHESLDDFYILFSAHGVPVYFLLEGDPYPFLVAQTVARIMGKLGRCHNWTISYQSAVGPLQWLRPATENVLKALSLKGVKKVVIVPVSFVSDHIETLCEIEIEYRHLAEMVLGMTDFRMTKAIECHQGFIEALADCVEHSLGRKPHG